MGNNIGPFQWITGIKCASDGPKFGEPPPHYAILSCRRSIYWAPVDTPTADGGNRNQAPRFAAYMPDIGFERWTPNDVFMVGPYCQGFSITPPGLTGLLPFGSDQRSDPRSTQAAPMPLAVPADMTAYYLWHCGEGPAADPDAEHSLIINVTRIRAELGSPGELIGLYFGNGLGGFLWELRFFDVPSDGSDIAFSFGTLQRVETNARPIGMRSGEVSAFLGSAVKIGV